jgi:hypothetical protein
MSCTTYDRHDRPGLILAEAMAVGRRLAALLDDDCGGALDRRGVELPTTVAAQARSRDITDPGFGSALEGLVTLLDAQIHAGAIERIETDIVGADEDGPIYADRRVWTVPDALQPLVEARDLALRLAGLIEEVRDIVAADVAVMRMRQEVAGR